MPLVRRRGPSPASLFAVAGTRPSRYLRSASICFVVFLFIVAAPRPLRLRRGFVVTTAPLNNMFTLTTYDFLLLLCNNFVKENRKFEYNYFKLERRKILQNSASER